jgi:hypothetical protein
VRITLKIQGPEENEQKQRTNARPMALPKGLLDSVKKKGRKKKKKLVTQVRTRDGKYASLSLSVRLSNTKLPNLVFEAVRLKLKQLLLSLSSVLI